MSLYSHVVGTNKYAHLVMVVLDLKPSDLGRFRDAFFSPDAIVVRTRTGGGNREEYEASINTLKAHKLFLSEADCEYDDTFMDFKFGYPDHVLAGLREMEKDARVIVIETRGFKKMWEDGMAKMDMAKFARESGLGDFLESLKS